MPVVLGPRTAFFTTGDEAAVRSPPSGTKSLLTPRWRETDSNFRFLDLVEQFLHRFGAWSRKGPGSHSRVLTTDNGRFTARRARLALSRVEPPETNQLVGQMRRHVEGDDGPTELFSQTPSPRGFGTRRHLGCVPIEHRPASARVGVRCGFDRRRYEFVPDDCLCKVFLQPARRGFLRSLRWGRGLRTVSGYKRAISALLRCPQVRSISAHGFALMTHRGRSLRHGLGEFLPR